MTLNNSLLLGKIMPLAKSEYDTVLVEINVPHHDHLREMNLDLLDRHSIQARECRVFLCKRVGNLDTTSCSCCMLHLSSRVAAVSYGSNRR
nr:hypothetical protein [Tanacetum cinerariifolium]